MDKVLTYSSIGIVALVGLGFGLSLRSRQPSSAPRAVFSSVVAPLEPISPVAPTARLSAPVDGPAAPSQVASMAARSTLTTDANLMAELRALQGSSPLLALRLAREGNARYPDSPDAPERTWHVVKSLTDLGKFDEAREEAQRMMELYPPSNWTADIKRHVLLHPPNPPATSP